jgi:hypothetical protein
MPAKTQQTAGLPVKPQQSAARFAMSAFDFSLGPSYNMQIQFAPKPAAFGRMAAQVFDQPRTAVLPDQFILQRNNGLVTARISLAGATARQLSIDPFGFIAAGGDDMQTTQIGNPVSEGDVGAAPGHVGGYGDLLPIPGGSNNVSLFFILPGIQYLVSDTRRGHLSPQ